jgi:hypothetical protein
MPPHPTLPCTTPLCTAQHYTISPYTIPLSIALHNTTQHRPAQYHSASPYTIPLSITLHNTTQHRPTQYHSASPYTIPLSIALHNTTQHRPAQYHSASPYTTQHNTTPPHTVPRTIDAEFFSVDRCRYYLTPRTHAKGVTGSLLLLRSVVREHFVGEAVVSDWHLWGERGGDKGERGKRERQIRK